jgi:transposase
MRQAGISRGLADKWLRLEECPPRAKRTSRTGMAEDFREELCRRWEQGQQEGKQLLAAIRQLGYIGSYASLMRFLAPWRRNRLHAKRAKRPDQSNLCNLVQCGMFRRGWQVALLSKPKPELNGKQSEMVAILKRRCPGFAAMRHLVLSFRGILCNGKVTSLRNWVKKSGRNGNPTDQRVCAAIEEGLGSGGKRGGAGVGYGPVEGHINRLKTLKRQMYGRAKFELLRARTLPLAA